MSSSEEEFKPCHGSNSSLNEHFGEKKEIDSAAFHGRIAESNENDNGGDLNLVDNNAMECSEGMDLHAIGVECGDINSNNGNGFNFKEYSLDQDEELAKYGINLLLQKGSNDALNYFSNYRHESPVMNSGYSLVKFMNASISMDETKLAEALTALEETQKLCESSSGSGFFRSLRSAFRRQNTETTPELSQYEKYQRHIIVADSLLYQASLIISIQQDIPGFIRGGWMLRKSQKHFDKVHRELKQICDNKNSKDSNANVDNYSRTSDSSSNEAETTDPSELTTEEADRLLGAASFGYGLLQLCVSMLPPKIMRVISFLGFEGDRKSGLAAMEYASRSKDMRAPIAMLGLLWYHTIIRQFFSIDGFMEGVVQAGEVIERFQGEYGDAPLFLWFRGRLSLLKKDLDSAIADYQRAISSGQMEVHLLCTYEIGWASLLIMDWKEAVRCYTEMKNQPRWATTLYTYLAAISHGALGEFQLAQSVLREVETVKCRRGNPNDVYIVKRAAKVLTMGELNRTDYVLLILEILCIWNSLITTPERSMEVFLEECAKSPNKHLLPVKLFAEGCIYKEMGARENARERFEELMVRKSSKLKKDDLHLTAHAYFEMGTMLADTVETVQEGRELLIHVKDKLKDYELENRLHIRLHAAIEQIKQNGVFCK